MLITSLAVSSIALSDTSMTAHPILSTISSKYLISSLIRISLAYLAESPNQVVSNVVF